MYAWIVIQIDGDFRTFMANSDDAESAIDLVSEKMGLPKDKLQALEPGLPNGVEGAAVEISKK